MAMLMWGRKLRNLPMPLVNPRIAAKQAQGRKHPPDPPQLAKFVVDVATVEIRDRKATPGAG